MLSPVAAAGCARQPFGVAAEVFHGHQVHTVGQERERERERETVTIVPVIHAVGAGLGWARLGWAGLGWGVASLILNQCNATSNMRGNVLPHAQ